MKTLRRIGWELTRALVLVMTVLWAAYFVVGFFVLAGHLLTGE